MAAKKKTHKTAKKKTAAKAVKKAPAKKAVKKTAKKAVKKTAKKAVKKSPVKKKVVKKAAKKAVKKKVVKKVAKKTPAKKKVVKKAAVKKVAKKATVKKVVKKAVVKKAAPKKEVVKATPKSKPVAKKAAKKKGRRSSLVSTPPPPAPKKPKFVPPTQVIAQPSSGSGGKHRAAFINKQRQRLLDLRDTLVDSMSGMTRDTIRNAPEGSEASGSGQHQGDAGSDAYDRDFALSVLANEQDALYEIEQALRRIDKGNYGLCEISNSKIPTTRLEAIPFARLTVECQAQWEKEWGNRRFRPSNEVGFSGGQPQEDENSITVSLDGRDD
ncbi:MAG: TraR/DksA family transcriptional regulator [Akkermansiaceae bacterium]